ncbi:unnamed protein product [Effrenium voratum]|uniref:Uncharacterized protein n=1 Tax=Effrenium voratum TaxID=2562239 RepID=A0AA36IM77_9DINO|nr:unnamed protein product [Effrenium voratum]CAJ1412511.1 unnamed protein product [Effrenium voratum]
MLARPASGWTPMRLPELNEVQFKKRSGRSAARLYEIEDDGFGSDLRPGSRPSTVKDGAVWKAASVGRSQSASSLSRTPAPTPSAWHLDKGPAGPKGFSLEAQDIFGVGKAARVRVKEAGRVRNSKVWQDQPVAVAQAPEAPPATAEASEEKDSAAHSCIFFDWDDTLCPTSFLQQVVMPCLQRLPGEDMPRIRPESPFFHDLSSIAKLVESILRSARKLSSVAIVTLARRPWLDEVSQACLPGLNLSKLLAELQIPVFYAREHVPLAVANLASPGAFIRAKRDAMRSCVKQIFGNTENVRSFMSIGDADIEHSALQQLVGSIGVSSMMQSPALGLPYCKLVRFSLQPSIPELQTQLTNLLATLRGLTSHHGNINVESNALSKQRCRFPRD